MIFEPFSASLAFVAGCIAGLAYYAGLWWTVRKATQVRHPAMLLTLSFLVRVTLLMLVFVLVMEDQWIRLVFCLLGFVVSRMVAVKKFGEPATQA